MLDDSLGTAGYRKDVCGTFQQCAYLDHHRPTTKQVMLDDVMGVLMILDILIRDMHTRLSHIPPHTKEHIPGYILALCSSAALLV